jgi:hypothetical protein
MVSYAVRATVWVIIYLLFILAPLFALLAGSLPQTRDFWTEFSVAIGYAGLAMIGLQFGLTARFRYVTDPWGEDFIFHSCGHAFGSPQDVGPLQPLRAMRLPAVHTHRVSSVVAPRVKIVVASAAMVAQTAAMWKNAPVWPKSRIWSAPPRRCHIQPITARCAKSTRARPSRSGPVDQAKVQPMAWTA